MILLDHEVIHFGDPAFDIGFALAHFLSKAHHLKDHRKKFWHAALDFSRQYRDAGGPAADDQVARHTLACMLARVAGRSPLEYLTEAERHRQRALIVEMMTDENWDSVSSVVPEFLTRLD